MKIATALAVLAAALASTLASADGFFLAEPAGCGAIQTTNQTPKWAWITVYDVGQTRHLDYGWVAPFTTRKWTSGMYSCAGVYHVRGELKDASGSTAPGDIPNIFDTRVEIPFGNNHDVYLQMPVVLRLTDGDPSNWLYPTQAPWQFWWSHSKDPVKVNSVGEMPKIAFTNNRTAPVMVRMSGGHDDISQCIAAGTANVTIPLKSIGLHNFTWTVAGCDPGSPSATTQFTAGYAVSHMRFDPIVRPLTPAPNNMQVAQLYLRNRYPPVAVAISVNGGPGTCAEATAQAQPINVQPGTLDIAVSAKTTCNAQAATPLQHIVISLPPAYSQVLDVDPRPQ